MSDQSQQTTEQQYRIMYGPDDARRVDEGECLYEACDNQADFEVEFQDVTFLTCRPCDVTNALGAKEIVLEKELRGDA